MSRPLDIHACPYRRLERTVRRRIDPGEQSAMTYPDHVRSRALAAEECYGINTALIVLKAVMPKAPGKAAVVKWRDSGDIEITDEDREFFVDWDAKRRDRLMPKVERTLHHVLDAMDEAALARKPQAVNQYGVPAGILTDNLMGVSKGGAVQMPIKVASGATIQLAIIAPAAVRMLPEVDPPIEGEAEVVEGEP